MNIKAMIRNALIGLGLWILILWVLFGCTAESMGYCREIEAFEACRADPQCKLTADDHSRWIRLREYEADKACKRLADE